MNKYSYNFDENAEAWYNDSHDTIEECIDEARKYDDSYDTVYVGENIPFVPTVDAELLLDRISEEAYEFAGDFAENWYGYDYNKRGELDELSNELSKVVHAWMKKYGYYPEFWQVTNIEPYPLKEEAEAALAQEGGVSMERMTEKVPKEDGDD